MSAGTELRAGEAGDSAPAHRPQAPLAGAALASALLSAQLSAARPPLSPAQGAIPPRKQPASLCQGKHIRTIRLSALEATCLPALVSVPGVGSLSLSTQPLPTAFTTTSQGISLNDTGSSRMCLRPADPHHGEGRVTMGP